MDWRTYSYNEIKSMFPPRRHSIKTLKTMVQEGKFGRHKDSDIPGEVLLAEDAVTVYLNEKKVDKRRAKTEKQREKDKKFPKSVDTHFKIWQTPPEEYRIVADKAYQAVLNTPSVKREIAKCADDDEVEAYLKQTYSELYARVQWGHAWKAKKRAWSHVKQREYFENASLDIKTQVQYLFDEKEREYFWQQLYAYAMVYGLADPVKKDLIIQIIFESIYIQKRRGQLMMHADDVIDKTFLSDLNVSQERFLKLVNTLNAIHYRKFVPTGKMDKDESPPGFEGTGSGDDID